MKRLLLLALITAFSAATSVFAGETVKSVSGAFHGKVYQVDTIFNFVDVDTTSGRERIYADDKSVVHVRNKRAQLIDIAMGEEVKGTYRTDAKGTRLVVRIDDLTTR